MALFKSKSTLVSLAVIMALSACGKSKDLKTAPAAAPTPAAEQPAPAPQTDGTPAPEVGNQELLEPNQIPHNNLLPEEDQIVEGNDDLAPLPVSPADELESEQSNVVKPPLKRAEEVKEEVGVIDFANQDAVKTGGQTKDLYYTSAGADGLMEEFKSYGLKVSKEQQKMNATLAQAIVTAKLTRSTSTGEVMVDLAIDETLNGQGGIRNYKLSTVAEANRLRLVAVKGTGGDLDFQGGFLKCVDLDGGCETAYAKIKLSGAYARVIFRNSYAHKHFFIQENVSNPSFDNLKRYILNTTQAVKTEQKIQSLQVSSFEVTNGRAGMGAMLTTKNKELIGLSIPLVVSARKSEVNAQVAKMGDLNRNYDLSNLSSSYSQSLSQGITDVKLINNNGLGQLRLKMTLGSANAGLIWMDVSPVKKEMMSLQQIRDFEATIKAF